VHPQPVADSVTSGAHIEAPANDVLSPVRHYRRVDCLNYTIPDDAVAI